jgi:hypothetical protein
MRGGKEHHPGRVQQDHHTGAGHAFRCPYTAGFPGCLGVVKQVDNVGRRGATRRDVLIDLVVGKEHTCGERVAGEFFKGLAVLLIEQPLPKYEVGLL